MKIFHILDSLNVGGLENGVVNLVNALDREKYSHIICCLRKVGPMAQRISNGVDVKIFSMNNNSRDYFMPLKLRRLIRCFKPDIVHTRNWGTIDGIIAAKLAGVKYIIHGEHGREYTDLQGSNFKRNLARCMLAIFVNYFVAVSDEIKYWLVNKVGISENKIITIINGVDTKKFYLPIDKRQAKKDLGIDPDTFIIGTVGRLDKVKNYKMLLDAVLLQKARESSFKVLFIGDGPERSGLGELVKINQLLNVEFCGQKENVQDYLQTFDLFVLTSLAEGISNTILEAMAGGVPVLATRVGGNSEIVEDGITGSLIPSENHVLLSKKIGEYMKDRDLCEKQGMAGRLLCEKRYSLDVMVAKYDKLYSSIMTKKLCS